MTTHTATLWIVQRKTDQYFEVMGVYPTHAEAKIAAQNAAQRDQLPRTHYSTHLVPFYGDLTTMQREAQS